MNRIEEENMDDKRYWFPVKPPGYGWGWGLPLVHVDDHPVEDIHALALQVSIPEAIERFVRQQVPQARHVELCHDTQRIVVRRDGPPIGAECRPMAGDDVISLGS